MRIAVTSFQPAQQLALRPHLAHQLVGFFALEEAASSWDSKLMWSTLTDTTSACFVLAI